MVKPGVSVYFRDRHLETAFFLGKEIKIGRLRDNDIVLDNIGVSRHHARIFVEEANFVLEDLKSSNGTRVNGLLADRVCLSYGDQISIGRFTIIFHLLDTQNLPRNAEARKQPGGNGGADRTTMFTGGRIDLEPLGKEGAARDGTSAAHGTPVPDAPPPKATPPPPRARGEGVRGVPTPLISEEGEPPTRRLPPTQGRPAAPRPRAGTTGYYALLVFKEGQKLAQKPLDRTSFSIGRSSDNDLILSGPEISRYHATITQSAEGFQIEDMASRNGVRVNGIAVNRQFLTPGDEFEIGRFRIVFVRSDVPPIEKFYRDAAIRELAGVDESGKTQALDSFARELMAERGGTESASAEAKGRPDGSAPPVVVGTPVATTAPEARDVPLFYALERIEVSLNYKGWILDQGWRPTEITLKAAEPDAPPGTIKLRLRFPAYSAEVELPLSKMRKVPKSS